MKQKETHTEATVTVSQTVIGKSKEETKQIKIRPFITETANIEVHAKRHIPLGPSLGNATVAVTISSPAYVEEIVSMYKQLDTLVDKILEKKINTILDALPKEEELPI